MTKILTASAIALLLSIPVHVFAAPIQAGAIYGFSWNGDGTDDPTTGIGFEGAGDFDAEDPGASPWTFSGEGTFGVLDLQLMTDQFTVYDNGELLGISSTPGGGNCGLDIEACFFDPNASSGLWEVGPGDHSITIVANGVRAGRGVFQYTPPAPVPVPAAAWLFGSALLGMAGIKRRKR